MTSYSTGPALPATNQGGATQPRPHGSETRNPGGPGAVPAVVGKETPVIAKGGAVNNG